MRGMLCRGRRGECALHQQHAPPVPTQPSSWEARQGGLHFQRDQGQKSKCSQPPGSTRTPAWSALHIQPAPLQWGPLGEPVLKPSHRGQPGPPFQKPGCNVRAGLRLGPGSATSSPAAPQPPGGTLSSRLSHTRPPVVWSGSRADPGAQGKRSFWGSL